MRKGNIIIEDILFFFQAEDGIRDLVRSRGLGDVYKRQTPSCPGGKMPMTNIDELKNTGLKATIPRLKILEAVSYTHLTLPTSDLV